MDFWRLDTELLELIRRSVPAANDNYGNVVIISVIDNRDDGTEFLTSFENGRMLVDEDAVLLPGHGREVMWDVYGTPKWDQLLFFLYYIRQFEIFPSKVTGFVRPPVEQEEGAAPNRGRDIRDERVRISYPVTVVSLIYF